MENVKLYREILDLLEEHDCGFQVIEEMVKTMTSRIPKLEERIRKAQKQGQKTYISHLNYKGETDRYLYKGYDPVTRQIIMKSEENKSSLCEVVDTCQFIFGDYSFNSPEDSGC
ncbi:hypothetical protein IM774_06215 [Erysipelotrichaceae bacterium RD49]|nr:hypothetical protein [Erysipelotrichaceae bacterium RD49]